MCRHWNRAMNTMVCTMFSTASFPLLMVLSPEQLKIKELLNRLADDTVKEVIIATDPNTEGEATAYYLSRLIKPLSVRVTRIARGLPAGGDVGYADSMTLAGAVENRKEM